MKNLFKGHSIAVAALYLPLMLLFMLCFSAETFAQTKVIKDTTIYYGNTQYPQIRVLPITDIHPAAGQSVRLFYGNPIGGCLLANTFTASQNYIVTTTPRKPGYDPDATSSTICDVMQTAQYFDGLGRPTETVQVKGNPDASRDVVELTIYDQFGREPSKFLPYTSPSNDGSYKPDGLNKLTGYYSSPPAGVTQITSPYSQTVFENSPLNRTIERGAPGDDWQPGNHTVRVDYTTNNNVSWASDQGNSRQVVNYGATINADLSRTLVNGNYYNDNRLTVTVTKDENWASGRANTTEEYKDLDGRVILKRTYNYGDNNILQKLSTYYVYDDIGNLVFVLPPGADPDNSIPDLTILNTLCYQYQYDERNRMVNKHLPGKDWDEMIYNNIDQVIFTQDGNQRLNHDRGFIKYDGLGRVIMTGIENSHWMSRADLQAYINTLNNTPFETPDSTGYYGYTNVSVPGNTNTMRPLVVNYYDKYAGIPDLPGYAAPAGATMETHSLPIASQTMILNPDGSYGPALWNVNYYDDKGRNIATYAQHYLNATANVANYDLIATTYDNITNEVTATNRKHYTTANSNPILIIANTYTYDHMGRKKQATEQINQDPQVVLSQTDYNDIGQLKTKHLGDNLQAVNYTYNERGWLRTAQSGLFNLDLAYNAPEPGVTQQFNGNIAEMQYNGSSSGAKSFKYSYDNLNRLINAQSTGGTLDEHISYDTMGNITQLIRGGAGAGTLNYTSYTGNQLDTVTGYSPRIYNYDANGNVTSDGVANNIISYNALNLPQSVGNVATYIYDAAGQKLRNTGSDGNWDYDKGIVYKNGVIEYIETEEGRATPNGGAYAYQYDLKDHLGDVRLTFHNNNGNAEVLQEDEYYAFGLRHNVFGKTNNNRHLYNGKELQVDLANQYDYGARFYDPVIARWTSVDPLAEQDRRWSSYSYGHNNPIRFIDIDGLFVKPGDPFKTPDAAAKDFAKLYNDNSIKDNKEFATTIYKVGEGKDAYYTYTPPAEAKESSSQPKDAGSGLAYEDVATAHTHGAYSGNQAIKYDDNHFSPADKDYAKATDMPNYVATPNGSLQKVDTKGNITTVAKDIPSDANDPTRLNKVDATKMPKNEPTYSAGDWLKFKILLPIGAGAQGIKN